MTQKLQAALLFVPPHGTGDADPCANYNTAVTAAASASADVLPANGGVPSGPGGGCYVTFVATVDTCIRFHATSATALTTDFMLPAGVIISWVVTSNDLKFSVIRAPSAATDGVLARYRSER